jgi:nucleotide-binding universal stress UspA family protein
MANPNPRTPVSRSMESHLDEERREILALLGQSGGSRSAAPSVSGRSSSPYVTGRSPIRSMLDVGDDAVRSPPRQAIIRSMLDIGDDPFLTRSQSAIQSGPNSPVLDHASIATKSHHPRSFSDASPRPMDSAIRGLPKVTDLNSDPYGFGIITSHGMSTTRRSTRRVTAGPSLPDVRANEDGDPIFDRGRQYSQGSSGSMLGPSRSPAGGKADARSRSPLTRAAAAASTSAVPSTMAMLDDGRKVDINSAYRRLSDANLAISGGSLSQLAHRRRTEDLSGRLTKDWIHEDTEYDDTSDDAIDSDDEHRGRTKMARKPAKASSAPALSLLGAIEDERLEITREMKPQYVYKSLFDEPTITVTNPAGDKRAPKVEIHPSTAYESGPVSGEVSGIDSDDAEDVNDIHRAQKLSFSMTPILTRDDTHRAIRIIYRGEYQKIVKAAEEEHRPLRKYVAATDLSEESTHALEWAIGTVLRDGDTLVCIYCVDEETGIGATPGAQVPDDVDAIRGAAAAVSDTTLADSKDPFPLIQRATPLLLSAPERNQVASTRPISRERTRAEEDRIHAVRAITDKVVKLLRKTRLQVRVTVEVIHCKNPKHLITEVIDIIDPTLVILGSRGRSALKGWVQGLKTSKMGSLMTNASRHSVILGSFSNYLVTKSSAPVMVARKRLRKSKFKTKIQQQVNNLSGPSARRLANAKID